MHNNLMPGIFGNVYCNSKLIRDIIPAGGTSILSIASTPLSMSSFCLDSTRRQPILSRHIWPVPTGSPPQVLSPANALVASFFCHPLHIVELELPPQRPRVPSSQPASSNPVFRLRSPGQHPIRLSSASSATTFITSLSAAQSLVSPPPASLRSCQPSTSFGLTRLFTDIVKGCNQCPLLAVSGSCPCKVRYLTG